MWLSEACSGAVPRASSAAYERRMDAEDAAKAFLSRNLPKGNASIQKADVIEPTRNADPKTCAHDYVDVSAEGRYGSLACARCSNC